MSKDASNAKKDRLLGEPHGTAANRLRKMVMFRYVQLAGHDDCHQCGKKIERVEDLSVEHKTPWQSASDPVAAFFDLENISFSHLRCNVMASDRSVNQHSGKTHCKNGHAFSEGNTCVSEDRRRCRQCRRDGMRQFRN